MLKNHDVEKLQKIQNTFFLENVALRDLVNKTCDFSPK